MTLSATASRQIPAASRRPAPLAAAGVLLAGFALLAIAVAAGWLNRLDQWAIDHTMPWNGGTGGPRADLLGTAFPVFHRHAADGDFPGRLAVYLVTWPASAGPAAIIVAACLVVLWRRGRRREAAAWGIAFAGGNAVEILVKGVLVRPALSVHSGGIATHIVAYDSAYPSGHALRAILVAAIVGTVLPQLRPLLVVWACAVIALLDVGAYHVPSDIVGAIVLGIAIVLLVRAYAPAARIATTSPGS